MVAPKPTPQSQFSLPSGDRLPSVGLGCWLAPPSELFNAVAHALNVGYRHIDGATIYGNESSIAEGIRDSGVPRDEIWVTTKLWNTAHRPGDVLPACKASRRAWPRHIDLWLMHYPCAMDPDVEGIKVIDVPYTDTWRAMEECVDLGLVRNIGVSNFSKIELEKLLADCRIRPAVHQLERHPYLPQNAFVPWHKQIGMHISAYSPLGSTNPSYAEQNTFPLCTSNPVVEKIARKWDITPANVLISLQLSEGHSVLPKSVTPSRITENLRVVQLDEGDVKEIAEAFKGMRHRYCDWSKVIGYDYYVGLDDED